MQLKRMKALWGMRGSLENNLRRIADAGYDGVETAPPGEAEESKFRELLEELGLDYIAMVYTGGEDHYASFEQQVERAARFAPLSIVSHSVKDSTPYGEQLDFFAKAIELERRIGIPVAHETHRGRAMFTPWSTASLLRDLPELRITADFSHWCCVCESLLDDQAANLALAIERTIHIHARVGYAEGPQVPHPAAPEYARELAVHEGWWERILQHQKERGRTVATVTPEFGPPGYMHTLPFTGQPVADLWDVCLWMSERLQERFGGFQPEGR
ncbi:sugar phosphate isomerase/epimerase family protein [Paenibacillus rigui]|uniref:Xylose isomerase n=1 Tax=Paenibacillus rigui TaxID=554312 RepID=A0A229UK05_9BACL|nr:TIM barrel protein [Paenibacillus rigui]OXM83723.1 xylose isomerase [Paenibacillus rigui]